MAVVENQATEIGDIIYVVAEPPILGISSLDSWSDVTVGEGGNKVFTKEFKYTLNGGITWSSDWIELTNGNLQAIAITETDPFQIQYQYTRSGTDPTGVLEFTSVTINTTSITVTCGAAFNASVFKEYFNCNDPAVLDWAVNVLQKLYDTGTIPNYITRGGDRTERQDDDFVKFWFSITTFFAFLVYFARQFEDYESNAALLEQYLLQKDSFLCRDENLTQLQNITQNIYRERRERGSTEMYQTIAQSGNPVNGELLRLICYDVLDEFILGVARPECIGWNLNNSSPAFFGQTNCLHMTKGYEFTKDMLSVTPYPVLAPSGTVVADITDGGQQTIEISGVAAAGISGIGDIAQVATKAIIVDPSINYEITFEVRASSLTTAKMTFGCRGFDDVNSAVSFENIITGVDEDDFVVEWSPNLTTEYYQVRGILYKTTQALLTAAEAELNIGDGQQLRSKTALNKIIPYIVLDNTNNIGVSGSLFLYNIKVAPCSLEYSRAFLDNQKWIDIIAENNSGEFSNDQVDQILRHKLIPYNTSFKATYL